MLAGSRKMKNYRRIYNFKKERKKRKNEEKKFLWSTKKGESLLKQKKKESLKSKPPRPFPSPCSMKPGFNVGEGEKQMRKSTMFWILWIFHSKLSLS